MKIEVFPDAASAARAAAVFIARESRIAIVARGRFVIALSGGSTPWLMLRALTGEEVQWERVHIIQVDERVAPAGDSDRNLTHLHEHLLAHTPLRPSGTAVINGKRIDVVTEGPFVERGSPIKVVAIEGMRVVVRPLNEQQPAPQQTINRTS